jgi:hypothetical protein
MLPDLKRSLPTLANKVGHGVERREWQSLEGDFRLSATCTPLGNVVFNVELHGLQGATEEWAVTAGIDYELGQLERLFEESDSEKTR